MYGLSGASGKLHEIILVIHKYMNSSPLRKGTTMYTAGLHCCLWCTIPSAKLATPLARRGKSPQRTLDSLCSDHARFLRDGGNIKKAKEYNNVIEEHLFDISLDNVKMYSPD